VGKPEIVTRGFVAAPDAALLAGATERITRVLQGPGDRIERMNEIALLKEKLKDGLSQYLYESTRRRPMVMPVVVEV
jgi:ribonuclease J